jgi:hypothetical protein
MTRTLPLLFVLALPGCTRQHPEVFDSAIRAASALVSAADVGVNYPRFGELLSTLVSEVDLVRSKVTTVEEGRIVNGLIAAVDAYRDSYTVWGLKIKHGALLGSRTDIRVFDLALKYDIRENARDLFDADAILQSAWTKGKAQAEQAIAEHRKLSE